MGFYMLWATQWGGQKTKNTEKWDEIGHMLVPGALNDTKKIRKASADIFAIFALEKPGKNKNNSWLNSTVGRPMGR